MTAWGETVSDLIAFIEARLAEDEAAATACAAVGGFRWAETPDDPETRGRVENGRGQIVIWDHEAHLSGHIARHNPARVLREVEAKRGILAAHPLANDPGEPPHCETCRYIADPDDPEPFPEAGYPCPTLRMLAMVWADHPDYRAEWRPE